MTVLQFTNNHPILTFFICYMVYCGFKMIFRTIMVAFRGWPPEHLDADGDYKKETTTNQGDQA